MACGARLWATDGYPVFSPGVGMTQFLEQVVAGIAAGGIYASLALALVLIYRAMGLINFAQGEFAMFTAFICWSLLQGPQVPFALAVIGAVVIGAIAAFAIERVVVRPFERGAPLAIVIVTLALFEIANSLAGFIWGYTPRSFPSPFPAKPVDIGGILVSVQDAAVIGVSLVTLALLYLLFNRSNLWDPGRTAHPARTKHDAERDHLCVRGRRSGRHRQSAWRGRGWTGAGCAAGAHRRVPAGSGRPASGALAPVDRGTAGGTPIPAVRSAASAARGGLRSE